MGCAATKKPESKNTNNISSNSLEDGIVIKKPYILTAKEYTI
jgi:hypothetical protein